MLSIPRVLFLETCVSYTQSNKPQNRGFCLISRKKVECIINMKFYRNLCFMIRFIWKHNRLWLFLEIIFTIVNAVIPLANLIIPKYVVNAIFQEKDFQNALIWIAILACIDFGSNSLSSILGYCLSVQKNKLFCSFNIYIAEIVMDMDYKNLENPETLDMRKLAMRSAFSGGAGFCGSVELFFNIITSFIVLAGAAIKISNLSPFLIAVILVVVVLNAWFNGRVNKSNYILDKEKAPIERENDYTYNLINDFSIGKEVRLYGLKDYLITKYRRTTIKSDSFYNKAFLNNTFNRLFSTATSSVQLFWVYFVLAYQTIKRNLFSYGEFIVQFNAINTLSTATVNIVTSVIDINQKGYYISDLENFVNIPKAIEKEGRKISSSSYRIKFDNVSFKYPGASEYSLQNINLEFSLEDKIALVGINGAGKTTLVKLLLRLYDVEEGKIYLNGIDIMDYDLKEYRNLFSAVFQDINLFAYSLKENITFTEDDADEKKLSEIVCESDIEKIVKGKSKGLDTYIYKIFDESGFEPSGGEGQKIAIARALYRDSSSIILDEPASALDPLAEYDLYRMLNKLLGNRGCIFISHRLSSASFANHIYVFDNGKIVEHGKHMDLMNIPNGLYKEMFDKQASYYRLGDGDKKNAYSDC